MDLVSFRKLSPKQKGEIAEINITARMMSLGYSVSKPIGDNQPYDLILDKSGILYRVQCKLGRLLRGNISFNTTRCRINSKTYVTSNYIDKIDYFAVWLPELPKEVYLVPIQDVGSRDCLLGIKSKSSKLRAEHLVLK